MSDRISAGAASTDDLLINTLRACGFFVRQTGLLEGQQPQIAGSIDNAAAFFKLTVAAAAVGGMQPTAEPDLISVNQHPTASANSKGFIIGSGMPAIGATFGEDATGNLVLVGSSNRRHSDGAGAQPFPQAWPHTQRIEAAQAFLAAYSDTNTARLLAYEVQPAIRRLASMIGQWQQAAIDKLITADAPKESDQTR